MPSPLWKGRLTPAVRLIVDANHLLAWFTGEGRDTEAMKNRIRRGFEGEFTDLLARYDELGGEHFLSIAETLLDGTDLKDKEVLDLGCGTGILSFHTLERGAARVLCGDFSARMLDACRTQASARGLRQDRVEFQKLDAEALPFDNDRFDGVTSSMMLGLVPNQAKAVREMARVVRPGGLVAMAIEGPNHHHEASDASFRACTKFNVVDFLGYRMELWAVNEKKIRNLLSRAGLRDPHIRRLTGKDVFMSGTALFEFHASTTGLWWYDRISPADRGMAFRKTREYFLKRGITRLTRDVILAHAFKP